MKDIPLISVTGTKGKTTTVSLIAAGLQHLGHNVMHVDTSGHYVNSERESNAQDSLDVWGIKTVTQAPGRYLGEFLHNPQLHDNGIAVLEASFSCYKRGLGYGSHDVGVFLNVFNDHIDPEGQIKNRHDLAMAKSFIFSSIARDGYAVFNADDDMVCRMLDRIQPSRNIHLIPCGSTFEHFDTAAHIRQGGAYVSLKDRKITWHSSDSEDLLMDLSSAEWAFNGMYEPLAMNMMYAAAAIRAQHIGTPLKLVQDALQKTRLSPDTGRSSVMKAANGSLIIADFAHEPESLKAVAKLGRQLLPENGKLWGIVRLSHERSDEVIHQTGALAGSLFDELIIYDKIDGHFRVPGPPYITRYPQEIGRVSKIMRDGASETNTNVERIVREDEAIQKVAQHIQPDDVVVVIVNDDTNRSLGFIREAFSTEA